MTVTALPTLSTDLKYRYPGRYWASWGALALLVVVSAAIAPAALHGSSIELVSALAGVLALAALGQMLIIMLGAIDLSLPAIIAASAGVTVHFADSTTAWVIAGALGVAVAISFANGLLISSLRLNSVIVTLGTFGMVSGAIVMWTGVAFSNSGQAPAVIRDFAGNSLININVCFFVAVLVGVLLSLALTLTRAGRQVVRVGDNHHAARAQGISVERVELATFAGAGLLYGMAGILVAGFIATPDISVGLPYQLASITVVAIAGASFGGGPASIASVLSASVFLTLLDQTLATQGLSAGARVMAQGVALVVAIAVITIGGYAVAGSRRLVRRFGGDHNSLGDGPLGDAPANPGRSSEDASPERAP